MVEIVSGGGDCDVCIYVYEREKGMMNGDCGFIFYFF